MLNNVELIGRVGKKPEMRYTPNNKAVCKFSIATNELGKENTTWHNVTAWDKIAELCVQYVKKGDLIYIQGRIEYTEKDGKYYTAIVAQKVNFLSSNGGSQSQASNKEKPVPPPPQKRVSQPETQSDDLGDDDIPF